MPTALSRTRLTAALTRDAKTIPLASVTGLAVDDFLFVNGEAMRVTAVGTASIDKDLLNVGKVLRLSWRAKLTKLVLPSALPYIFTGMRLSLGVGWMVLIAAEMLAQNPGLGKFVWDEFQNGSSDSLSRLMVAVFSIGIIGFLLDRVMFTVQTLVDFSGRR